VTEDRYEIHFHHVGGYGGALPLPIPRPLRRDVNLYLYDANAESMDRVRTDGEYRRQMNIGQAVFDRDGQVDVHITYHPAASSLFPVDPDAMTYWAGGYVESDMCDILMSDFREVRRVPVPCTTIDALRRTKGIVTDFLSLDAEGSERQILDGAHDALSTTVVGLISEVHFMNLRTGQTTAGELFDRANRHGFHMADLRMHEGRAFARLPLGWRTVGAVTSGDAFFFKRIDVLKSAYPAPGPSLAKLALFCLLTGRLEHGVAAALAAQDADPAAFNAAADFAYVKLLAEITQLYRQQEPFFLPTWSEYYPTAEAGLRHGESGRGLDVRDACRRYFSKVDATKFIHRVAALSNQDDSPLESLLKRYELNELAVSVKQHRQRSLIILLNWLDLLDKEKPTTAQHIAQRIAERLA